MYFHSSTQDADRLESIGAFGIARCMGFSSVRNRPLFDPTDKPVDNMTFEQYQSQTENNEGTATRHFYGKLQIEFINSFLHKSLYFDLSYRKTLSDKELDED